MIRRLLHFTGLALLGLWVAAGIAPAPRLRVEVPPRSDPATRIDEAVLLAEAERLGWIETDLVVRRHLIKVYGEATGQSNLDPAALFEEAKALGLHHADRVVRSRLLDRAWRALRQVEEPDDATLAAHLRDHPERFATVPQYTISLRYRDRARHGERWPDVVAETARASRTDPEPAADRLPLAVRSPFTATEARIEARFGRALARTVAQASVGVWVGPIATETGAWFVRIDVIRPGRVPPLAEVRAAVRADWVADAGDHRAGLALQGLRKRWRIEVVQP